MSRPNFAVPDYPDRKLFREDTTNMRTVFAHQAVLVLTPEADIDAPGAAVTSALCTHWGRQRPCPLVPHHTHAIRDGAEVRIRFVFAVEPAHEGAVRCRIERALATGHLCGPSAANTQWQLCSCAPAARPRKKPSRSPTSFMTPDEPRGVPPVKMNLSECERAEAGARNYAFPR